MARRRKVSPTNDYREEDRGYTTPCWIWQRGLHGKGYGLTHVRDPRYKGGWRTRMAHIASWEAVNGPVPPGKELDHLCRQRPCIRPDHLQPITHAKNVRRGRLVKLDEAAAAAIRASDESPEILAARFGVTVGHIRRVLSNRAWQDDTRPIIRRPNPRHTSRDVVNAIRENTTLSIRDLALKHGVHKDTVRRILRYVRHKEPTNPTRSQP